MSQEIERKYLVLSDEYRHLAKPVFYKQGYLSHTPESVVRLRIVGEQAFLTIKGSNKGITRLEFEYDIPLHEALEMFESLIHPSHVIEKYRYSIFFAENIWEIDHFLGKNEGLVIAEIELEDESQTFEKPQWIGKEVSHDTRYYNSNLAQKPYSDW